MTRVDEFDVFYSATVRETLAVTYAACGDRQAALETTTDAYERAWRHWARLRGTDPSTWVRQEAWKHLAVNIGTHPLRRRRERDSDLDLLAALRNLNSDERRLVTLMTIANLDLDHASAETEQNEEKAIEAASRGFEKLERALDVPIDEVASRIGALREITDMLDIRQPAELRSEARRHGLRNTLVLFVVAVLTIGVGGVMAADGGVKGVQDTFPYREKIGAESPDIVLQSHNLDTDDLLSLRQVRDLNPAADWRIEATDTDVSNETPYSTCPTERFADPDPLKVFVRAYESDAGDRVAQSIEVSASEEASLAAHEKLIGFYANCVHQRVRLIDSYTVERPFGDFQVLRLQSYRKPARFISVGLAQSGTVTSTVVHESPGRKRTDVEQFAQTLNQSIARVCADSGGQCSSAMDVVSAPLPPTREDPGFLSIVDLPPIRSIDEVWNASPVTPVTSKEGNPAASLCDKADFSAEGFSQAGSRLFFIPDAPQLPPEFAVAQTVGVMSTEEQVKDFVTDVSTSVTNCVDRKVAGEVEEKQKISGDDFRGNVYSIRFELTEDESITFQMGIVRRGNAVAQVYAPPAGKFTLPTETFRELVYRAGERLAYASTD